MGARDRLRAVALRFPAALSRLGVVDRAKGIEAFDLAVPVMVTGGLRVCVRLADFLMVGIALGDAALAGLELGFQYYFVGFGLSLAVSAGTISVVSRLQGADEPERANLAVKQAFWLGLALSVPLTVGSVLYAGPLVGLLSDDPTVVDYGATYLSIVMLSMAPRFWSVTAARALAGSADTRTPMYVRAVTLPTNIGLNAVLVFGWGPFPELGIAGAAVGTAVANTLAATVFVVLLVSGRYAVTLRLGGRQLDPGLLREIVRVGLPLSGVRLLRTFGRFPFLFVLGVLGTAAVAAYAVGRRVVLLAMMPAWGYSTSLDASPPHGSSLPVRQVARGATHASPFQSARKRSVGSATEHFTSRQPMRRDFSWRTERARAAGGERSEPSRLSGPYSSERGAVLLSEREYPAQRPPAARGLSTLSVKCGAVEETTFFQASMERKQRYIHASV